MQLRKMAPAVLAGAGMLVLILDGQTALIGAASGVDLCLKTVVPSLFPFFFLCSVLTQTLWGQSLLRLRPLCRMLGIPEGAEPLLISALLGGYPAGAQAIGESFREKRLSEKETNHLLTFCSNAGPAFLFGMTALQFGNRALVWALWAIQIISAFLTALCSSRNSIQTTNLPDKALNLSGTLKQAIKAMGTVCGWIILFRILSEFLNLWFFWRVSPEIRVVLTGLLELSNGCLALSGVENQDIRFLICSVILSFGGLCVAMQTASVIDPLPLKPYLKGKVIQALFSLLLSPVFLHLGWSGLLCSGTAAGVFLILRKKAVAFRDNPVYNATINTGRTQNHAVS